MCFHNNQNQNQIKQKLPSIVEVKIYVAQIRLVVLGPLIQTDFSFRKLILKMNNFILCIAFSILIFSNVNIQSFT